MKPHSPRWLSLICTALLFSSFTQPATAQELADAPPPDTTPSTPESPSSTETPSGTIEGPFAEWGMRTPNGAENYE
ncbi:hypothetical protein G7Y31_03095 [Corynebacterium lizhenjunii]|uniref:Uncharacterized protein n=1 Tax=Corynebacterium lizhenjunii TaxID=2709394 RepID=A0A7T0KG05_9CORY|nr:hypothetical protein [Corynebacterium lizhenjunii]QPK79706.1 hypothetical protein G7Y31_03095 [Corynebacterium lizhenjunii]